MATVLVLLIIAGCAAYQYFKGSLFKALVTIIITICACAAAFGYFEAAANRLISQAADYPALRPWAQPLCFALIFILAFAILQTAAMQLAKHPLDLGLIPERLGRVLLGSFLGLILSGIILTTLAMAPLPEKYPYQRFDRAGLSGWRPRPNKVLLNPDGLVCGWFGLLSRGSFKAIRSPASFATLHPAFIDQLYLNRQQVSRQVPLLARQDAIQVPRKNGAWYVPPATIKKPDATPITPPSGTDLLVVRMGLRKNAISDAGRFTLGQLRLICKPKDSSGPATLGKAINVYPIGYFSAPGQVTMRKLDELITIDRTDFQNSQTTKYVDFLFGLPNDYAPVLLEFKLTCVVEVPRPVSAEQAPAPAVLIERAPDSESRPGPEQTPPNPQTQRPPRSSQERRGGLSPVGRMLTGGALDETDQ